MLFFCLQVCAQGESQMWCHGDFTSDGRICVEGLVTTSFKIYPVTTLAARNPTVKETKDTQT